MDFKTSRLLGGLPLLLSLALGSFIAFPQLRANRVLLLTFIITAGLLAIWSLFLMALRQDQNRTPVFAVALLKQHYVQACAHASILLYWGWYFRPVYNEAYLILAQLVFAYAFDMLLQLSRRGRYTLGFGAFPIVFSTNLFLWFFDHWFYFQFALIAVGYLAKEFLKWKRDGKLVHIFNPSSFPLAIASWVLLFTHQFHITWGEAIAGTQFRPPQIFLFIFLVSLPGQFFFGVTTMTLSAVVTMYVWAAAYMHITGLPYHFQSYIPIAVFLAMNLLFTDPSTSPRSELGRILFGIAYGATVVILELIVEPEFPSKLLVVPLLNLAVPLFERAARSPILQALNPARLAPAVLGRRRNLGYMTVWAGVFLVFLSLGGIGDNFFGQELPFWREACQQQVGHACKRLAHVEKIGCHRGSGWACNDLGIRYDEAGMDARARDSFASACKLGFIPGCDNLTGLGKGTVLERAAPSQADYPVLLSLFKWIRREKLETLPEPQLMAEACSKGWREACDSTPATVSERGP